MHVSKKENIIGWAKAHSKTCFSVNDWKRSKTPRRLKRTSFWMYFDFRLGWSLFKVKKQVSRSARSKSWLCFYKFFHFFESFVKRMNGEDVHIRFNSFDFLFLTEFLRSRLFGDQTWQINFDTSWYLVCNFDLMPTN